MGIHVVNLDSFFRKIKLIRMGISTEFSNQQIPFLKFRGFRILNRWRYALGSNLRPGDHFGSRRARGWESKGNIPT